MESSLCDSCKNTECIFQCGVLRENCAYYVPDYIPDYKISLGMLQDINEVFRIKDLAQLAMAVKEGRAEIIVKNEDDHAVTIKILRK